MKQQLPHRRALLHVRHVLERFNGGELSAAPAADELGVSRSTVFGLRKKWLAASRRGQEWTPGVSGGCRHAPWPKEAAAFLATVLSGDTPYSYAFAASEMERLHGFRADRAQVRLWALRNGLARATPKERVSCHTRRRQRQNIGELWQPGATPFPGFGPGHPQLPMLNMLDDCSRLQLGAAIHARETLGAYIHFLAAAFERHGLPLQIYVDRAAFFKSPSEEGSTRLKNRLAFYGISFIYAHSPESKGKIERLHQVWQDRLPCFFAKNGIPLSLGSANERIAPLIDWRNGHEHHRETGMTALAGWEKAASEGCGKLRQRPACPWWDYVWPEMERVTVRPRRRVMAGGELVPVNASPGGRVILCAHTDGFYSVLKDWPQKGALPVLLFTDRPGAGTPPRPPTVQF